MSFGYQVLGFGAFPNRTPSTFSIANSAMFDKDNTEFFNDTPGAGDQQKWTISWWSKFCNLTTRQAFVSQDAAYVTINENAQPSNRINLYIAGSSPVWYWETNATDGLFRDPTAWYNIVVAFDSTNGTADHRLRLYINGVEFTDFQKHSTGNQNSSQDFGNSAEIRIGEHPSGTSIPYDGYMAEFVWIDGTQHAPTSFGEFSDNGVWKPIDVSTLTFGTKGFYLPFSASGSDLGDDASGNGFDFTNNNTVTQSGDSPTKNFATVNITDANSAATVAAGNLKFTGGSTWVAAGITQAPTQKTYWEFRPTSDDLQVGVNNVPSKAKFGTDRYYEGTGTIAWQDTSYWNVGNNLGSKTGWSSGDVCALAFDPATGKTWFAVNNTWNDSGDPAAGSNASLTLAQGVSSGYEFFVAGESGSMILNFGQDDTFQGTETAAGNTDANGNGSFYYTPPTGFFALAAKDSYATDTLTVRDGSAHYQSILWSGNSSSQTVTQTGNSGFTPDWAIIKSRSFANGANSFDVVRGGTKGQATFDTGAEDTNADGVAFGISSEKGTLAFTGAGDTGDINNSGRTYVGLTWKAGGSASTNTDGNVDSEVSVNTTSGISIGTFTGNGSGGNTVGHGLGVAPRMVWVKNRGGNGWAVYSAIAGEDYYMYLDAEGARVDNSSYWNDTAPTSTLITLGHTADVNASGGNILFYAMADVAGYQKIGAYIGNGNANGPFINIGFKPAWVMIKSTTQGSTNWEFFDDNIEPNNVVGDQNFFNITNAEADNDHKMDFVANGFKIRDTSGSVNTSGATFLYWAIAKHPFGGDGSLSVIGPAR